MATSLDDLFGPGGGSSMGGGGGGGGGRHSLEPPPADEHHMQQILNEMNNISQHQGQGPPPPQSPYADPPRVITEPPITMSTGQYRMDTVPHRANIIGNSQPTAADFHSVLQQMPPGMLSSGAPYQPFRTPSAEEVYIPPKKTDDWKTTVSSALRGPFAVAVIVFLLNLPVVTATLSRYASWMYLTSGEVSVPGLLVKSLLAATLFGLYQTGATVFNSTM